LPAQDISVDISQFIEGSSRLHMLHFTKSHKIWYKRFWTVWILQ